MFNHNVWRFAVYSFTAFSISFSFSIAETESNLHSNDKSGDGKSTRNVLILSEYDALVGKLKEAALNTGISTKTEHFENNVLIVTPSKENFLRSVELVERIKWYRGKTAETCEVADPSAKAMGEFIDSCVSRGIISDALGKATKSSEHLVLSFNVAKLSDCKTQLDTYFKAKRALFTADERKNYSIDWEIDSKLVELFDIFGAKQETSTTGSTSSPMTEALKTVTLKNLCLIETNVPKPAATSKKEENLKTALTPSKSTQDEDKPKKSEVKNSNENTQKEKVLNLTKEAIEPQKTKTIETGTATKAALTSGYQAPQNLGSGGGGAYGGASGYGGTYGKGYGASNYGSGTNYDPTKYKYDSKQAYNYGNIRDYGGNDYSSIPYIPQMNYPGNSQQPHSYQSPMPYFPPREPSVVDDTPLPQPYPVQQYPRPAAPYPMMMMMMMPPPPPPPAIVSVDVGFSIESSYRPSSQVIDRTPNLGLACPKLMGQPCQNGPTLGGQMPNMPYGNNPNVYRIPRQPGFSPVNYPGGGNFPTTYPPVSYPGPITPPNMPRTTPPIRFKVPRASVKRGLR